MLNAYVISAMSEAALDLLGHDKMIVATRVGSGMAAQIIAEPVDV